MAGPDAFSRLDSNMKLPHTSTFRTMKHFLFHLIPYRDLPDDFVAAVCAFL
ncbi:MAG: hypothetical protein VCA74_05060 [Deltaproteobacteria bacterium]